MNEHPPFQLIAGHVALDFVNTLDYRYDPERVQELIGTYSEFLRFCTESEVIDRSQARSLSTVRKGTEQALRKAYELREVLERLFGALTSNTAIATRDLDVVNALVQEALSHRALAFDEGKLEWSWLGIEQNPLGPLWLVADAAVRLMTSEDVRRVRQCGNESCRWLFLDTSKNHSRRWCDMKLCGNRIKARNYYRRTRQEQDSP